VIYEAFVEGKLEAPKHLARTVHDLYFEPQYEEFKPRTIWSLSNAFTSAFKELDPIPPIQGDSQAGRIPGSPVFTIVLTVGRYRPDRPFPTWQFELALRDPHAVVGVKETQSTSHSHVARDSLASARQLRLQSPLSGSQPLR
jgi:hypothetical protein